MRTDRRGRPVLDAHRLPPRYAAMLGHMSGNVLGQAHAFPPIINCIQRYESGLNDPNRPVGAGFLGGPTGVGKTLTAEQISIFLHGRPLLIRIACGELQERGQAVANFVGAPPSYIGHGETVPLLTQEFLDQHKSENSDIVVLLLDEFEKAHPDFQKLLLNVEENGLLTIWVPKKGDEKTPGKGAERQEVKMYNVLILKTTNAGVEKFAKANESDTPKIGFGAQVGASFTPLKRTIPSPDKFRDELRTIFAPEFLNRQDFFVFYNWLQPEHMPLIRRREVAKVEALVNAKPELRGVTLRMTAAANRWVEARGFDADYGARPLRRLIQNEFVTPIGNLIAERMLKPFDAVAAQPSEDGQRLDFVPLRLSAPRAKEKLAIAAAADAGSKVDTETRVMQLEAAIAAIMSALPQTSSVRAALEAAVERASQATNPNERADVLRLSIDTAIQGRRPMVVAEAAPQPSAKSQGADDPVKLSAQRALVVAGESPTHVSGGGVSQMKARLPVKTAGSDEEFREQMIEVLASLGPCLPTEATSHLAQTMFALTNESLASARLQLAETLEDIAMTARPSMTSAGEVREATAGALRAMVNLETDAALGTVSATRAIEEGRTIGLRAINDAAGVSGAQPQGDPESEVRGSMPFAIFLAMHAYEPMHDDAIERLDAMREVLSDVYYDGEPLPDSDSIDPPAHVAQAVGIAYAAEQLANATLRKTVQSTIDGYLEKRPLQATPGQLQGLEDLIRDCADAPPDDIAARCASFARAQLTSGSLLRGAESTPTAKRRAAILTAPRKTGT